MPGKIKSFVYAHSHIDMWLLVIDSTSIIASKIQIIGFTFLNRSLILKLGLLLDSHQIPIGMKIYPGNQSEKPVIRNIIDELKQRNQISGRTIQVVGKR